MRALVLFSGTGSVDRSLAAAGFQVDNLDIDPKCGATWTCDVMDWDAWRDMAPGTYDFIHTSPPCTMYSIARTTAKTPRDMDGADRVVQRTLDIIAHLKPLGWLMENPQTGYLRTRDVVVGLPFRELLSVQLRSATQVPKMHPALGGLAGLRAQAPVHSEESVRVFENRQASYGCAAF